MQPTTLEAQQAALREVRARYERGELTSETFERALDALLMARDAEDCAVVLAALPPHPLAALAALDAASLPAPPAPAAPNATESETRQIVAFMSQTKKLRRPWRLAASMQTVAFMGEVKLDLRLAELPSQATMRITAIMGTVVLYVPRTVRVAVHSAVYLSDVDALGEHTSGVVAFGHEEHAPPSGAPSGPRLDVEVFALMGNVRVVLVDERGVTIRELVRDAVQAATDGIARGLRQGSAPRPTIEAAGERT